MNRPYFGDCIAIEKLKNNSVCIKEGLKIRNIKSFEDFCYNQTVFVSNIKMVDEDGEHIEEGKAVRYTPIGGMLL